MCVNVLSMCVACVSMCCQYDDHIMCMFIDVFSDSDWVGWEGASKGEGEGVGGDLGRRRARIAVELKLNVVGSGSKR